MLNKQLLCTITSPVDVCIHRVSSVLVFIPDFAIVLDLLASCDRPKTMAVRDIQEELREIRNSKGQNAPTLTEIESILPEAGKPTDAGNGRHNALLNRMLPPCYTSFTFSNVAIHNLHEETLFYIFYMINGSELQLKAYNELIGKGYFYSTQLGCFVMLNRSKIVSNTRHNIIVFDPLLWEKTSKEVMFDMAFVNSLKSTI